MSHGKQSRVVLAFESVVAVLLVAFVGWSFRGTLKDMDPGSLPLRVRPELLVAAGVLYLLAHLCWSTFWVRLLHYEGVRVSWYVGLRTYYISQIGKYVPGKFLVPFMRMGMLRPHGGHPFPVGVTAVYETLSSMAAGRSSPCCSCRHWAFCRRKCRGGQRSCSRWPPCRSGWEC